jgi:hypothetical protein
VITGLASAPNWGASGLHVPIVQVGTPRLTRGFRLRACGAPSQPALSDQVSLAGSLRAAVVWRSEQYRRGRFGALVTLLEMP